VSATVLLGKTTLKRYNPSSQNFKDPHIRRGNHQERVMAEGNDRWLNYLATTTVLLAVLATLSTFFGQKNSTRSVISEIKASNQWNYFQAKKIRSYLFEVQKEGLEIDLKMREETIPASLNEQMQKRVDGFGSKIAKWQDDMSEGSTACKAVASVSRL
jgi:hypothetical protein